MTPKTTYDKEIDSIGTINYLPWIGSNFENTRIQIIGDSHYDDGDGWLPGNRYATRQLIHNNGLNSDKPNYSKAPFLRVVEKVICNKQLTTPAERATFWNNVSFSNLSQRLMPTRHDRPNDDDFDIGWTSFLQYALIVKPTICIKLAYDGLGRLGYYMNNHIEEWHTNSQEFWKKPYVINLRHIPTDYQTKIVVIKHPTGTRGFKSSEWSDLILKEFPNIKGLLGL